MFGDTVVVMPPDPLSSRPVQFVVAFPKTHVPDALRFVRSVHRLGQRVVVGVAHRADLGAYPAQRQKPDEALCGVLAAFVVLVGNPCQHIVSLLRAVPCRHLKGPGHHRLVHLCRHVISHYHTGEDIDDEGNLAPALPGGHVGEVGHPHPVGFIGVEVALQQVVCAFGASAGKSGALGLEPTRAFKPHLARESCDALAPDAHAVV